MKLLANQVVAITGASSGIGKELAKKIAKQNAKVILLARSLDKIKALEEELITENCSAEAVFLDVTSPNSIIEAFNYLKEKYGRIDVLINNAAIGLFEQIKDTKIKDAKAVFETNFFGPLFCIQQVLPVMRKQKQGCIVNLSSAIAKSASFYQGVYSASKSSLDRLSESLRIEEKKYNIQVLTVYVDRTKTNFRDHVVGPKDKLVLPFKMLKEADPKEVAEKIVRAIADDKEIYHTTLKSRLFSLGSGVFPFFVNKLFTRQYQGLNKDEIKSEH